MRFSVFIGDILIALECGVSCLTYSVDRETTSRPQVGGIALNADPMRLSLKRNCRWSFIKCSACLGLMAAIAYEQHSNVTKFTVIAWMGGRLTAQTSLPLIFLSANLSDPIISAILSLFLISFHHISPLQITHLHRFHIVALSSISIDC